MDEFLERRRIPIILFLLAAIVTGGMILFTGWPQSTATTEPAAAGRLSLPVGAPALRTVERQLKVYVSGAVRQPGVYDFRDGERVEDAIRYAGGLAEDADTSTLNLAQRLRDEGRVAVPRRGATPVSGATSSSPATTALPPGGKVNINKASLAQLEALPGIGDTYAQRIIEYRTKNGPFQAAADLVSKKILPQSTYNKIADLIDVQ